MFRKRSTWTSKDLRVMWCVCFCQQVTGGETSLRMMWLGDVLVYNIYCIVIKMKFMYAACLAKSAHIFWGTVVVFLKVFWWPDVLIKSWWKLHVNFRDPAVESCSSPGFEACPTTFAWRLGAAGPASAVCVESNSPVEHQLSKLHDSPWERLVIRKSSMVIYG